MPTSLAHIAFTQHALIVSLAMLLAGCATLPPPTGELSTAQQALSRADDIDADQYAPAEITQARSLLGQAQSAMASHRESEARSLALLAAAEADLAYARSREASSNAELAQRQREISELRQQLENTTP